MGPPAAGKTDAAIALAETLPVDLISVDSAMVYRGMDIGTGKPDTQTLAKAPHALIDIREPWETYSAADFAKEATALLESSWDNARVPLLVGGTSLYFRALLKGFAPLPQSAPELRLQLDEDIARDGIVAMHERLAKYDPDTAARLHPNDTQRIQRAMEVILVTGQPMSELLRAEHQGLAADVLSIVVSPAGRTVLHDRIALRFDAMLETGLVEEVRGLMTHPNIKRSLPALRSVGYRQTWDYLAGDTTLEILPDKGKAATRQLARRQLTWLRSEPDTFWLDPTAADFSMRLADLVKEHVKF